MQTVVWKGARRLEVMVQHHRTRALYLCYDSIILPFLKYEVKISNDIIFFSYVGASYEIYENLHHSKFSRYTVHVYKIPIPIYSLIFMRVFCAIISPSSKMLQRRG